MGAKMLAIQKIRSAPFRDVPGARDIEMSKRNEWVENAHLRFLQGAYFQTVASIPDSYFAAALLAVLFIAGWRRQLSGEGASFYIAGFASIGIYIFSVSLLLAFIYRYQVPYQVLLCAMLGLALGEISGSRRGAGTE